MRRRLFADLVLVGSVGCCRLHAAENEVHSVKCSSAMEGDGYVYVAGQSGARADGSLPTDFSAQASQAFDKVKAVITAAGLTMDNVVYLQIYLDNVESYPQLAAVFKKFFPTTPPAAAVL